METRHAAPIRRDASAGGVAGGGTETLRAGASSAAWRPTRAP